MFEERVAFEQPVQTADGAGGTESGWVEAFQSRAHFRYLRGGETVLAGRLQGRTTVVSTIHSNAAARQVTHDWRMRDLRSGTIYNVRTAIPSDDRAFIELTCESGVAA